MALDPGFQQFLQQQLGGGGGGQAPQQQGLTKSDIETLLLGTVRQSLSTHPLQQRTPAWIPAPLRPYVRAGAVDPYLGTGDQATWRVFMGGQKGYTVGTQRHGAAPGQQVANDLAKPYTTKKRVRGDKTVSLQQAMNEPYLWDEAEVGDAIKRFQAAGVTSVTDFNSLTEAWGAMVQRAGAMYSLSAGQRKVTPWDVLDLYKKEQIAAGIKPGPGDPNFNGTLTQVSKSVSDISEGDAWASLQGTLSQMLGRDPSDEELRDFTYRMNSLAARNPSITKTIQRYKNGQIASTSSHTSAGFGANDVAEEAYQNAQADPEYAEYQAATTYFNALASALGPIGG